MASELESLKFKEQLSFRVTYAMLRYGAGLVDGAEPSEGHPILHLELKDEYYEFKRLLGKRPATAWLHRHPTGVDQTGTGISARGQLRIFEIEKEEEGERARTYVSIHGLLPEESFDTIASALITGGRDLLSRCRLQVELKEDRDKIDFEKREGPLKDATFLLGDLSISFEIGDQYDELSED